MKLGHRMRSRSAGPYAAESKNKNLFTHPYGKKSPVKAAFISVLAMFLVSGLLLLLLAMLLYKMELEESVVKIGIIVIYVIAGMAGGFLMGKQMREKKYLWGLAAGAAYFVLLLGASVAMRGGFDLNLAKVLTTMALCCASGMAGGMAS